MFSVVHMLTAVVVAIAAAHAFPTNITTTPQRDPYTGLRVNSTTGPNSNRISDTPPEGGEAACEGGQELWCKVSRRDIPLFLPERSNTTGQNVDTPPSVNSDPTPHNSTVNNNEITGYEGAQAACDRGFTDWCEPKKRGLPESLPERSNVTGANLNSPQTSNNSIDRIPIDSYVNGYEITGFEGGEAACDRGLDGWCPEKRSVGGDHIKVDDYFVAL